MDQNESCCVCFDIFDVRFKGFKGCKAKVKLKPEVKGSHLIFCGIRSPNEVNTRHQGRQVICVSFIDPLLRSARQLLIEKH